MPPDDQIRARDTNRPGSLAPVPRRDAGRGVHGGERRHRDHQVQGPGDAPECLIGRAADPGD